MRKRGATGLGVFFMAFAAAASAQAAPWDAASGLHGGGLGMKHDQSGRVWVDSGFYTNSGDWLIAPKIGVGFEVTPSVELEAVLPIGIATGTGGKTALGNPYFGVSYIMDGPRLRLKVGGGIALPIVKVDSFGDYGPILAGLATSALQESYFWYEDAIPLVAPLHLEAPLGTPVSFVGDAAAIFVIAKGDRDRSEFVLQLAPGFAYHASDSVSLGVRMPIFLDLVTRANDQAQMALEPFVRFASDPVFFSVRFTMPLDEPLGFAFDRDKFWGLHLGLGVAF